MKIISIKTQESIFEMDGNLYSVNRQELNPAEWTEYEITKQVEAHLRASKEPMAIFNSLGKMKDLEEAYRKQQIIQLQYAIENNKWEDLFSLTKDLGENCSAQIGMYNQAKQFELAGGNAQPQYARIRMWATDILKKYQQ